MRRGRTGRIRVPMTLGDAHLAVARGVHPMRGMTKLAIGTRVRYIRFANPRLEETSFTRPRYGRVEGFLDGHLVQVSWDDGIGPQTVNNDNVVALCACGKDSTLNLCVCEEA